MSFERYRVIKLLKCSACGCEEYTVHCETADGRIRCEICGNDSEYYLTREREVLRAD